MKFTASLLRMLAPERCVTSGPGLFTICIMILKHHLKVSAQGALLGLPYADREFLHRSIETDGSEYGLAKAPWLSEYPSKYSQLFGKRNSICLWSWPRLQRLISEKSVPSWADQGQWFILMLLMWAISAEGSCLLAIKSPMSMYPWSIQKYLNFSLPGPDKSKGFENILDLSCGCDLCTAESHQAGNLVWFQEDQIPNPLWPTQSQARRAPSQFPPLPCIRVKSTWTYVHQVLEDVSHLYRAYM